MSTWLWLTPRFLELADLGRHAAETVKTDEEANQNRDQPSARATSIFPGREGPRGALAGSGGSLKTIFLQEGDLWTGFCFFWLASARVAELTHLRPVGDLFIRLVGRGFLQ